MRRLGAGEGIPERCSREPREVELAFWAGTPWKVQYFKHLQQNRASAAGYVGLQVSLMDSRSLPLGVLEYCCIHQQQMDELSWRQPTVYLWLQFGIDEALVAMVLCPQLRICLGISQILVANVSSPTGREVLPLTDVCATIFQNSAGVKEAKIRGTFKDFSSTPIPPLHPA